MPSFTQIECAAILRWEMHRHQLHLLVTLAAAWFFGRFVWYPTYRQSFRQSVFSVRVQPQAATLTGNLDFGANLVLAFQLFDAADVVSASDKRLDKPRPDTLGARRVLRKILDFNSCSV